MSKVVFILGAGASKQAGAPLMADFLDVASNLLRANQVAEKKIHFERVFSTIGSLQAVHSKSQLDLNNIESIFTVLELGKIIQKIPNLPSDEIQNVISALKEVIVKTLEVTMYYPMDHYSPSAPQPYGQFANLLTHLRNEAYPQQSVSVITFNYDLAVDLALYDANLGPNYIIEDAPDKYEHVDLLKLHGSLNWAIEKKRQVIRPLHLRNYFQHYRFQPIQSSSKVRLSLGSKLVEYFSNVESVDVEHEPVIVPPSWNKADYHSALSNVWAAAAQHLSEAEHIFIIGYSLPETDSFFKHLYALGSVGTKLLNRIEVFNPDSTGLIDNRFRTLLGPGAIARYTYHQDTFERSIETIRDYFPKRSMR